MYEKVLFIKLHLIKKPNIGKNYANDSGKKLIVLKNAIF